MSAAFTERESREVARGLNVWKGALMRGRHVVGILGAAGALMAVGPATDAGASFTWTAGSIGEAFGPGHTATEVRDGLLFAGGGDPYLSGGHVVCCRPTRRS